MKKNLAAALFIAAAVAMQFAWAEDKAADATDMQALRAAVRADKKAYVASMLKLTDAEAKRFWPIYDGYQRVVDAADRRRVIAVEGLISRDKPVTDLYAKSVANELIAADEAEIRARRSLYNRLMRGVPTRVLPQRKAARYLQLEAKIWSVKSYDVASTIPLMK
jgi:Spy/CpxP family protein refolding chaperone